LISSKSLPQIIIVATHGCAWTSPGGVAGCVLEAGDKGLIKQRWKKKDACISDAMGDDRGRGRERTNPLPPTPNNQ